MADERGRALLAAERVKRVQALRVRGRHSSLTGMRAGEEQGGHSSGSSGALLVSQDGVQHTRTADSALGSFADSPPRSTGRHAMRHQREEASSAFVATEMNELAMADSERGGGEDGGDEGEAGAQRGAQHGAATARDTAGVSLARRFGGRLGKLRGPSAPPLTP